MNLRIASLVAVVAAALVISFQVPGTSVPYLSLDHGKHGPQPAAAAREIMKRARNTRSIPINADLFIRRIAPGSPDGPIDLHHQPWDWIEIFNRSDRVISLAGYSLSDDPDHARKFRFPPVMLPAQTACRVWLSGFVSMNSRWSLTPTDAMGARGWKPVHDPEMSQRFRYMWLGFHAPAVRPDHDPHEYRLQLPITIDEPGRYALWLHAGVQGSDRSRIHVLFNGVEIDVEIDDRAALAYLPLPCPTTTDGYWDLTNGTHTILGTVVEGDTLINELVVTRYDEPFGHGVQDLYAGIKLRQTGEFMGLFDPDGVAVDHVTTPALPTGMMATRDPGHNGTLRMEPVLALGRGEPLPAPWFDQPSGPIPAGTPVQIFCDSPQTIIRYTLNGELPTPASPGLTGPIPVASNTVLRACSFDAAGRASPVSEATYWVDEVHGLPILSVIAEPSQLYDFSHGILYNTSIRGLLSERRCHMTLIETNGQSTATVGGMRIQGRSSRETSTKRNLRFVMRKRYGQAVWPGDLFAGDGPNRCRSVVATGRNIIRNQLAHELMDLARVRSPRRKPVRLFVNAQPFGMYLLLEDAQDPNYLESTFGHLDLDVIKEKTFEPVKWGNRKRFDVDILSRVDKSRDPITFEALSDLMDIDMLCRWMTVIQYAGVDDSGQGYYVCDHRAEGPPWSTINWDFDHAFTIASDQGWPLPQGYRSRLLLPVKNSSIIFQKQHYFPSLQHLVNHILPLARLPERTRELITLYRPFLDEEFQAHLNQRSFGMAMPDRDAFMALHYVDRWEQLLTFVDTRAKSIPQSWGDNLYGTPPHVVHIDAAAHISDLLIDSWPARPEFAGYYYPDSELTICRREPEATSPLEFEINGTVLRGAELRIKVKEDLTIRIRDAKRPTAL